MMAPSSVHAPLASADDVRRWFEADLARRVDPLLEYGKSLVERAEEYDSLGTLRLAASSVEELNPRVEEMIRGSAEVLGAGYIAAPQTVDGRDRYMLWLTRRNGDIRRLHLNFDTTDLDAYDYVWMDWYVRTRDRNAPSLTGPFLDYAGSDALVFTVAAPVRSGLDFLGVVAVDLVAQKTEDLMTARLCQLPGEALVVNHERTVVATNSARWLPGERLPAMPNTEAHVYEDVIPLGAWSGWQLAVASSCSSESV